MRTLALKKETLTELAADDLRSVVGAAASLAATVCLADLISEIGCQSWHTEEC